MMSSTSCSDVGHRHMQRSAQNSGTDHYRDHHRLHTDPLKKERHRRYDCSRTTIIVSTTHLCREFLQSGRHPCRLGQRQRWQNWIPHSVPRTIPLSAKGIPVIIDETGCVSAERENTSASGMVQLLLSALPETRHRIALSGTTTEKRKAVSGLLNTGLHLLLSVIRRSRRHTK